MRTSNTDLYQTIQEALEKQPMLMELFDVPFTGIALLSEDGTLLHCNQTLEQILGYAVGDLLNSHFFNLLSAEHLPVFKSKLNKLLNKEPIDKTGISCFINWAGKEINLSYQIKLTQIIAEQNLAIVYLGATQVVGLPEAFNPTIYETIFAKSKEAIVITDAKPDGRVPDIIYVNKAFSDMCGYKPEECIGNQPSMLTGTETKLNDLLKVAETIKQEKEGVFELLNYKKDGSKFWVEFSILPIKNKNGICTHWVAFEKDITEQKNKHLLLSESETKYRSLVQNSSVGIYIMGAEGFSFVNNKLCELTGYSEQELLELPLPKLVYPAEYLMVNKKVQDNLVGIAKNEKYEFRIIKKTGEIRWFEANGSRIIVNGKPSIIGIISDSTERRESDEKIRKFSQAIEQSAASIIITNLASEIEYINPAFIKITGYTKEEIIGQNPRILKTEFNEKNAHKEMWEALDKNESWRGIFYNKRKNGETFWEQVVISPVFNAAGEKTNYVAVKDDISQKIQLENEKEKLIEELTISLNDLKQFSYITSHNLRAPITNLVGILDLLDTSLIADEETKELLDGFRKSTLKLNETLEDLIDTLIIKNNNNVQYKDIYFQDVLANTCQSLNNIIKESKAVIHANFEQAPMHYLAKTYIESIFQNIVTNAIKYAKLDVNPIIHITSTEKDGKIILSFSDNGMGMNIEKIKDRLFGLYQKFHSNKDSKGFGLFLIKSHVHAMNGQIELTSKVNEGTTITITFEKK